jgi:hypothetical protein
LIKLTAARELKRIGRLIRTGIIVDEKWLRRRLPLALLHLKQTIPKCNLPAVNNVTLMGAPMRQCVTHN